MSVVSDNAPHKCPVCGLVLEWCPCPAWPQAVAKNATARATVYPVPGFVTATAPAAILAIKRMRAYFRACDERDAEAAEFAEIERQMG